MQLQTLGPEEKAAPLAIALRDALRQREDSPALAILYAAYQEDDRHLLSALQLFQASLPCPLIGCTTGGVAFTERGFSQTGYALGLLWGDTFLGVQIAKGVTYDQEAIAKALQNFKFPRGNHLSLFLLADPFAVDGAALTKTIRANIPVTCTFYGGTAGDGWRFVGPKLFYQGQLIKDAVIFAGFATQEEFVGGVKHGWRTIDDQSYTVTSIEGSYLKTLDDQPAVAVYRQALIRNGLIKDHADLLGKTAIYSLGLPSLYNKELKIRTPMAIDERGGITLAGSIPPHSEVYIVDSCNNDLVAAAFQLKEEVLSKKPNCQGLLVVDCAGRHQILGENYELQFEAFKQSGIPLLGFASYGEFARFRGQLEGFHNTTAVMVGI